MKHPCAEAVDAATYLQRAAMPPELFSRLHHSSLKGRTETFAATVRYFGVRHRDLERRNRDYAQRLRFVAEAHRRAPQPFETLVEQALSRWPLEHG